MEEQVQTSLSESYDWRKVIERVKGIIFKPSEEWEKVKEEKIGVRTIILYYVLPLGAIGEVADFLAYLISGKVLSSLSKYFKFVEVSYSKALISNLFGSIIFLILWIAVIIGVCELVKISGLFIQRDFNRESVWKLVVFSSIPYLISEVSSIFIFPPIEWIITLAGAIYSYVILVKGAKIGVVEEAKDRPQFLVNVVFASYFISGIVVAFVVSPIIAKIISGVILR